MTKKEELKFWKKALKKAENNKKALENSIDYDKKSEEYQILHNYYIDKIPRLTQRVEHFKIKNRLTVY